MNKEDLETIEFWKDCIKHLEKEFQYPNYLGYFITIRDKECEYLKTTLNLIDKLQQKVNQLETNIEEAIEYIKHSWWLRTDQVYDTSKDLKGWEVEELLSILERGKK